MYDTWVCRIHVLNNVWVWGLAWVCAWVWGVRIGMGGWIGMCIGIGFSMGMGWHRLRHGGGQGQCKYTRKSCKAQLL